MNLTASPGTEEGKTLNFVLILLLVLGTRVLMFARVLLGPFHLSGVYSISVSVPICDVKLEAFPCRGHTNIYIK